jgi:PST family polysaccharide transporter
MIILSSFIIFFIPKFRSIWLLISINLLTPIFSAIVCEWFFQGVEKMHNITIVNTLSRVLFLVLVFVLIKKEDDYILFPVCEVLGHILAGMYSIVMITTKYKCNIRFPGFNAILDYIKQGKDIFLNQSCVLLFNRLPNILLGNISGSSAAGLYHAAFRLQDAGYHGVDTLNRTFFPFLARRMDKHKAYRRINLTFAFFIAAVLFVFAPFFVRLLYAPDFAPAVKLLRILSLSILFLGISSAYGVNHLLLIGKEKLVRNITFCVTGGGLLLLVGMIHWLDETGAAITMVIVNATFALSYFIAAKREKHKDTVLNHN